MELFGWYITIMSVVTFFMYGVDKYKASHRKWRIPENTLIGFAIIGGSLGALAGIWIWRHKTLHPKFKYGVPFILIIQVSLLCWLAI
ncbi:MAG: DUF1294 domain-containing protein [Bacteroidales bacterium]|nr:DUF1294 domain-containing protein [Bacteroidales bacterium]